MDVGICFLYFVIGDLSNDTRRKLAFPKKIVNYIIESRVNAWRNEQSYRRTKRKPANYR